jgi:ERCC4-type nuclease
MSNFTIIIDGREQRGHAYEFESWPVDTVRKNLSDCGSEGDYSIEGYEHQFAVERKALDDLASCCGTKRYDHFEPQVQRGVDRLDRYAIVVEAPRWKIEKGVYYSDIHPNSILGTIDSWSDDEHYGIDFHLCDDKYMAEVKTYTLLARWKDEVDRQS